MVLFHRLVYLQLLLLGLPDIGFIDRASDDSDPAEAVVLKWFRAQREKAK